MITLVYYAAFHGLHVDHDIISLAAGRLDNNFGNIILNIIIQVGNWGSNAVNAT